MSLIVWFDWKLHKWDHFKILVNIIYVSGGAYEAVKRSEENQFQIQYMKQKFGVKQYQYRANVTFIRRAPSTWIEY